MALYPNLEIALGQKLRQLIHIRRFQLAVQDPYQTQTAKLLTILRGNARTRFGRRYNFDKIRSIADFQKAVPVHNYEDLFPYIEEQMEGHSNQLSGEPPLMYATTSGTTGAPKFIPITARHLRDYTHAFQVHNYHMIQDYPEGAAGRFLIIVSNDVEGYTPSGVPYGAVSGFLNRKQPALIKKYFAVPYEVSKIKDVDIKYYLFLRMAAAQNVTAIMCCNPSSLILLADQLREHGHQIVRDLYDGSVPKSFLPSSDLASACQPYLTSCRDTARRLERILEQEGTLKPTHLWKNLMIMSCWKGGPMSFYLEKLSDYYGQVPIRDFGYMASEGRGTIPLTNDGAGGVLAITSHFFEFVPECEIDSPMKSFLTAGQLEHHKRYYIYFTTAAGLYRYNINDLIEVVGYHGHTPIIQFVRKGAGISSITGEKVTEEQVQTALMRAISQLKLTEIRHFTLAVQLGNPPFYAMYVELDGKLSEPSAGEFVRLFDLCLQNQNQEYQDKRLSKRLGPPSLVVVPPGTYVMFRQKRVSQGAPEAQVKIPLLARCGEFQIGDMGLGL